MLKAGNLWSAKSDQALNESFAQVQKQGKGIFSTLNNPKGRLLLQNLVLFIRCSPGRIKFVQKKEGGYNMFGSL